MSLLYPCLLNFCGSTDKKSGLDRRRKSVTLPLLPTYLVAKQEKAARKRKKGVKFPLGVLMQQAITDGDMQEIKQLVGEFGTKAVNEPEPSGLPPVMRAIFEGQLDALKLLVEAGADISGKDQENWTVMHVAAAMDDIEAAEYIASVCKEPLTGKRNADGERAMDLADSVEMARFLLGEDLKHLRTEEPELELSQTKDNTESEASVILLVVNHFDKTGNCTALNTVLKSNTAYDTLLHLAACKNYYRLANYILSNHMVATETRDRNGWTPLHTAAYYNSLEVSLLLADHGANINSLTHTYEKPADMSEHELIIDLLES